MRLSFNASTLLIVFLFLSNKICFLLGGFLLCGVQDDEYHKIRSVYDTEVVPVSVVCLSLSRLCL